MTTRRDILLGAAGAIAVGGAARASPKEEALYNALSDTSATFIIRNLATGEIVRHEPELATQPKPPFSTFKIWNTAIALDVGAIPDLDFRLEWDQAKYPPTPDWPEAWKQAQDVRSAFKASAVWFFREVALRVGPERMAAKLREIGYGNADISGGIDQFWLNSSLRISAEDQVERLGELWEGKAPLSPRTVGLVKEAMEIERRPNRGFYGKTGGGKVDGGGFDGWFVGVLTRNRDRYAFALHFHAKTWEEVKTQRLFLVKSALDALGLG